MSRKIIILKVSFSILINMTRADEVLDRCASSNNHTATEIETLLREGIKGQRVDCIGALLSNADFNNRGMAQSLIAKLAPDDQSFVLHSALQMNEIWVEPQKLGEDIGAFNVLTGRYLELFQAHGIQATREQLLSKDGRNELLRLQSIPRISEGKVEPSLQMKSDTRSQSGPTKNSSIPLEVPSVQPTTPKMAPEAKPLPVAIEESISSKPWSIPMVLFVAATTLLWLLRKGQK
jgi:hypothetical protein